MRFWLILIGFFVLSMSVVAQQNTGHETTAYRQVLVYDGPGITYLAIDVLNPGIPATIIERNGLGNWVRVQRYHEGQVVMDGWVITGYLNYLPDLQLGAIPVTTTLPDANLDTLSSQSLAELYTMPIVPTLSDAMIAVFQTGQTLGNRSNVITKVGDSLSASEQYINIFSEDEYELGSYGYLEPTLKYYADSTTADSVASRIGMTSYAIFDPFWADKDVCEASESPLECEFRLRRPGIAFILFGPNDVRHMTDDEFAEQMSLLVEETMQAGVIPVLFTFSAHPAEQFYWQSINFNLRIKAIAETYQVPAINLWAAVQHLPEYGLDEDLIHLKHSGFNFLKYDTGHEAFYGISLQNLLVLRTLHEIRLTLQLED